MVHLSALKNFERNTNFIEVIFLGSSGTAILLEQAILPLLVWTPALITILAKGK